MTNISVEVATLDGWQRVALAAMCAESLSPVVVRFAQLTTQRAFEKGLNVVWTSARNSAPGPRVMSVREALENVPEWMCDDSNIPSYCVMWAIGALANTLDAIVEEESVQPVLEACDMVVDAYSGYDYVCAYGKQTQRIDPRDPPPPGPLESLLIQSLVRSIEAMRNAARLSDVLDGMQDVAKQLAAEVDHILPIYANQKGWRLAPGQ